MVSENVIKEKLNNGKRVFGSWSSIPSTVLTEIIAHSGLDFLVIDAEHGPLSMETAQEMVRVVQGYALTPLIRIPANEPYLILRALDIGAQGVHIPHVSTAEDARNAVKFSKYRPMGNRGYSPFTRAGRFGLNAAYHAEQANKDTLVVAHVEGVEGVRNLKEIVKVKGLDVVFIGPYDLSQSLGKPGQVKDKEVIKLVQDSAKLIENSGLVCGSFASDKEYLDILWNCGVRYLTYMVDSAIILDAYRNIAKDFNNRVN